MNFCLQKRLAIALLVGLLLTPLAYASRPVSVIGTWALATTVLYAQTANGTTVVTLAMVANFTGTLTGTSAAGEMEMSDNGHHETSVFEAILQCTMAGRSGEIAVDFEGTTTDSGSVSGQWVADHGADGLLNVRGQGMVEGGPTGSTTYVGTYSGEVHDQNMLNLLIVGSTIWIATVVFVGLLATRLKRAGRT